MLSPRKSAFTNRAKTKGLYQTELRYFQTKTSTGILIIKTQVVDAHLVTIGVQLLKVSNVQTPRK